MWRRPRRRTALLLLGCLAQVAVVDIADRNRPASQRAAEKAQRERDEIPPPPEPTDPDDIGPDYDAGYEESSISNSSYSQEDEERDMADQARDEEGTSDRRDATHVAMDLLAAELGAKPL